MELTRDSGQPNRGAAAAVADTAGGAKLTPGGPVELLKLTDTGAVIEGRSRLAVGTAVTLSVGGPSPRRVAARVVRCNVSAIHRDSTMSYQLDLAFDDAAAGAPALDAGRLPEAPPPVVAAPVVAAPVLVLEQQPFVDDLVNEW